MGDVGRIGWGNLPSIAISRLLAEADHIWLVSFMDYDLGYFDDETCRLEPIEGPFGRRLLPMSPE